LIESEESEREKSEKARVAKSDVGLLS